MIEFHQVAKSYHKDKRAVDSLSLAIQPGEIFGFIGHNGAGKTSTIKMLTGITPIDEGDIFLDGLSIKTHPLEAKRQFGFVPDSPDIFLRLKAIEYLKFMASAHGMTEGAFQDAVEKLTRRFDMTEHLNATIHSCSHGTRQKIILMGALIHSPKNLILDEPMTGLDPQAAFTLKEIMKEEAAKGSTVFFSTHVLEVAEKLCHRLGIINRGKLIFTGTLEELKSRFPTGLALEQIFLELTHHD